MRRKQIKNILVVDDESTVVEALHLTLDALGYNSIYTTNSLEVEKLIKENQVDLVISDVNMPGLDGISLFRKVSSSGNISPYWVFISGLATKEQLNEIDSIGEAYFIHKPFTSIEIKQLIQEILGN